MSAQQKVILTLLAAACFLPLRADSSEKVEKEGETPLDTSTSYPFRREPEPEKEEKERAWSLGVTLSYPVIYGGDAGNEEFWSEVYKENIISGRIFLSDSIFKNIYIGPALSFALHKSEYNRYNIPEERDQEKTLINTGLGFNLGYMFYLFKNKVLVLKPDASVCFDMNFYYMKDDYGNTDISSEAALVLEYGLSVFININDRMMFGPEISHSHSRRVFSFSEKSFITDKGSWVEKYKRLKCGIGMVVSL